jgi:hypothetical protein
LIAASQPSNLLVLENEPTLAGRRFTEPKSTAFVLPILLQIKNLEKLDLPQSPFTTDQAEALRKADARLRHRADQAV